MTYRSKVVALVAVLGTTAAAQGQQLHKLLPSDGAMGDYFGVDVAIGGDLAIVGSYRDDDQGEDSGSVYLYSASTGQQVFKLMPGDGSADYHFGAGIDLDGTTAIIGSYGDDVSGNGSGSAYLYDVSDPTNPFLIAKCVPSDGAVLDNFGVSAAIEGALAIMGAPQDDDFGTQSGSAYLFNAANGQQLAKLLPTSGAEYDSFGTSVAIDGNIAAVGANSEGSNGFRAGAAYLFDVTTGLQFAKLLPEDGDAWDEFGRSITIAGNIVAVSAPYDDDNGPTSGSAYLFDANTGQQLSKLLASDGDAGDGFGVSVAIEGGVLMVGAHTEGVDASGSVYVFDVSDPINPVEVAKFVPGDPQITGYFGYAVSMAGGTALIGAFGDDDNGQDSGAAYVFEIGTACAPDLTGDGLVNTQDFIAFLNAWANSDPIADWNDDGTVNTQDFIAYLNDWAAGCP